MKARAVLLRLLVRIEKKEFTMLTDRHAGRTGLAILAAGLALCSMAACRARGGEAGSVQPRPGADAEAAALVQQFGGRAPRPCPAIRHRPSDAEAAILAQCTMEGPFGTVETLLTDVRVHISGTRPFTAQDLNRRDIDNRAEVLTLTGYAKHWVCGEQAFAPGKNCTMDEMPDSAGACWKTSYGEYRCNFVNVGVGYHPFVPPPTSY